MTNPHGRFAWHELSTTDPRAGMAFYPQITAWTTQLMDDRPDYSLWMNDGSPIGGVATLRDTVEASSAHAHWLAYVRVYDVDACARQVAALGGRVRVAPKEVPNIGCWAVVSDPQGGVIGLYEPASNELVRYSAPRRGEFSWHELMTTDYKAAFEFYRALFRWETVSKYDMGEMGIYHLFGQKGQTFGGMFNTLVGVPSPNWMCYVRVDDVKPRAETLTMLGGIVMNGPMEVPGGDWIVQCMDPQGATFALHTPKTS